MKLKSGDVIVFLGDSVTDCGRMGQFYPLGNGYVRFFSELLLATAPSVEVRVHNAGVGANTVRDAKDRLVDDALSLKPTWIVLQGFMADVMRHLAGEQGHEPAAFASAYEDILKDVLGRGINVLMLGPFYVSKASAPGTYRYQLLSLLPAYLAVLDELSKKHSVPYIDLHAMFQALIKQREPNAYALEPLHPIEAGHLAIALKLLDFFVGGP